LDGDHVDRVDLLGYTLASRDFVFSISPPEVSSSLRRVRVDNMLVPFKNVSLEKTVGRDEIPLIDVIALFIKIFIHKEIDIPSDM
jgi:hypothetical protein